MRKNFAYYLLPPLFTGALLLMVYWLRDIYPLYHNSIAWCDMRQQVMPLLMQTGDMIAGKGSLLYSLGDAGGMNFWGVFLFFAASPFSLLTPFVQKADAMVFANILVLLKITLCSLTAAVFFRKAFGKLSVLTVVSLSVSYAFCGYSMLFYQNNVWLDMMYLFPLLLLSARDLIEQKRVVFYTVMLALTIVVNYYISYCVILFLILSLGVYLFLCFDKKERGRRIFLLGAATAVAALLTAFVWLPSLAQYLVSARTGNLLDGLSYGKFLTHLYTTWPFLYCSGVIFAALPFVFRKKLLASRRIKALLVSFFLMLIPVTIEPINKMWHTGSYQAFPVRYGFITVMLGLIIAAAVIEALAMDSAGVRQGSGAAGACVGAVAVLSLVSFVFLTKNYQTLTAYTRKLWGDKSSFLYLSVWFLAALGSMLIIFLLLRFRLITARAFSVVLALMVCVQSFFSADVYIGSAAHSPDYFPWITDLAGRIDDDDFYRVKTKYKLFDVNLIGALGYPSLAHYTSLTREDYLFTMKRLGYSAYWMEVGSHGGSSISDALLQNRYIIDTASDSGGYGPLVYTNRGYWIYENRYQLPFGIVTDASYDEIASLPQTDRIFADEYVLNTLLGSDSSVVARYEPATSLNMSVQRDGDVYRLKRGNRATPSIQTYLLRVDEPETLYFDCFKDASNRLVEEINGSFDISVNGQYIAADYPSQMKNGLLELGSFENETVVIKVHLKKDLEAKSFGVFGIDQNALLQKLDLARGANISADKRTFGGTADAKEDGELLFLPIPYDEGFSATVNGEKAQVLRAFDSFIALRLQKGKNEISLSFFPVGMKTGILISLLGLIPLALLLALKKERLAALARAAAAPASFAFYFLFAFVFAGVYLLPLLAFFLGKLR